MTSVKELEREFLDSAHLTSMGISNMQKKEMADDELRRLFARSISSKKPDRPRMTYMELRKNEEFDEWRRTREYYKPLHRKWITMLCSNFDWDWDLSSCLKNLFKNDETHTDYLNNQLPTLDAAVSISPESTLEVSVGNLQASSVQRVYVTFKSNSGGMVTKAFVSCPPLGSDEADIAG